jgi:hypothetical protein
MNCSVNCLQDNFWNAENIASTFLQRSSQVKVKVTLRLTVSQSVSLGIEPHLGPMTRYLFLSDSYVFVSVGRPLWREDGCLLYVPLALVPWDLRPYFTVSDLRLPLSSPPTTRRVTVEVFDLLQRCVYCADVDHIENTVLLLPRACVLRTLPSNGRCLPSHCLATGLYITIHWCAFCFLYSVLNAFARLKG